MPVQPFRATVAEIGGRFALISLSGDLDLYVELELRDTLEAADRIGTPTVVVDLSCVSFLDLTHATAVQRKRYRRTRSRRETGSSRGPAGSRRFPVSRGVRGELLGVRANDCHLRERSRRRPDLTSRVEAASPPSAISSERVPRTKPLLIPHPVDEPARGLENSRVAGVDDLALPARITCRPVHPPFPSHLSGCVLVPNDTLLPLRVMSVATKPCRPRQLPAHPVRRKSIAIRDSSAPDRSRAVK
jgi:hypothetical protein